MLTNVSSHVSLAEAMLKCPRQLKIWNFVFLVDLRAKIMFLALCIKLRPKIKEFIATNVVLKTLRKLCDLWNTVV